MNLPIDPSFMTRQALAIQPDKNVNENDPEGLRKVCRQFEEVFLQQLFKEMRSTVSEGGLFERGNDYQMYRDMLDAQTAHQAASRGELGIGDALYKQLAGRKSTDAGDDPPPEKTND